MSGTHREAHLEALLSTWKTKMAFIIKFDRFSSVNFVPIVHAHHRDTLR